MFCGKCGASNADGATFCSSCGAPLNASSAPPAAPAVPEISMGSIPSGPATFRASTVFTNAISLVKSPAAFMRQNKDANIPLRTTIVGYVAILAAIPFLATLIGDAWYYHGRAGGFFVATAIGTYVLDIIAVLVIGFIILKLGPYFSTKTTLDKAVLLSAFVYTPVFLISIFDIIPPIGVITILGLLYGLYILYIGLPIMLSTPSQKTLIYVVAVVVAAIIVYAIIAVILGAIAAAFVVTHTVTPLG